MQTAVDELTTKAQAAKKAARELAQLSGEVKNNALLSIADGLKSRQEEILEANEKDYQAGQQAGLDEAFLDRLLLTPDRLEGIAHDIPNDVLLPDPVGKMTEMTTLDTLLQVGRRRVPLAVIGIIYQSRPTLSTALPVLC